MVDIIVQDYRAIDKAIVKVDGVTVLRGDSNGGKSSFIKALQAACTNRFTAGCIRYTKEFCVVKVRFGGPEAETLTIKRFPTGSPIISLGKRAPWTKLNRDLPNEVISYCNLGSINVSNSETYSLNFFKQFQAPLLSDYSQKKIMDILSASPAVDDLNKARKEIEIRRVRNTGAFNATSSVINDTKVRLAKAQFSLSDMSPLKQADNILVKINTIEGMLSSIDSLVEVMTVSAIQKKEVTLMNLLLLAKEEDSSLREQHRKVEEVASLHFTNKRERRVTTLLQDLYAVQVPIDSDTLLKWKCDSLQTSIKSHNKDVLTLPLLQQLLNIKSQIVEDTEKNTLTSKLSRLIQRNVSLSKPIPYMERAAILLGEKESIDSDNITIKANQTKVELIAMYLSQKTSIAKEYKEMVLVSESELCPTCKQPIKFKES